MVHVAAVCIVSEITERLVCCRWKSDNVLKKHSHVHIANGTILRGNATARVLLRWKSEQRAEKALVPFPPR